jgi:hypothetical protein
MDMRTKEDFLAALRFAFGEAHAAGVITRPIELVVEVLRFSFKEAFAHMREDPAFAVRTLFRKAILFWNDFEVSDNQDQYLLEDDSWVLRLPLLGFGWIAPLALLVLARQRGGGRDAPSPPRAGRAHGRATGRCNRHL